MKREFKAMLSGLLLLPLGLIFIVWGLIDILSVTGGPIELLIIVPVIVTIIFFLIFGVIGVVLIISRRRNILYKKIHNCRTCGAVIKLEEKMCANCGAENAIRYEALDKLEKLERKIEELKEYNWERSEKLKYSKRRISPREKKLQEIGDERLFNEERELRVMKTKLIIGSTREGKLEWIKTQHYDLNRSIQEIADDLGDSMIAVRNYLDEIENQDITEIE